MVPAMTLWIGTSGWQYRHWRGDFYPPGLPVGRWFEHYAEAFATVELNVTFYRQPRPAVFEGWARRAPAGFVFAVKASRFLTHVRRLREPRDSVDRLLEGATRLGPHLGPVLLQLPPDMPPAPDRLEATLAAFPPGIRVAVEARQPAWFTPRIRAILERYRAALCLADRRGPRTPPWATAPWGYIRFHAGRAATPGCYGRTSLRGWAGRVADLWPGDADVYTYFNNDGHGCAIRNAATFASLAARHRRETSRAAVS
jgi:uncharacterized protein YecE (DUF72 family)